MKKQYQFAGIEIEVHADEKIMYKEEYMMEAFRVQNVVIPHRFFFEKVEELTAPEGDLMTVLPNYCVYTSEGRQLRYIGTVSQGWNHGYIRALHDGKYHHVQLKRSENKGRIGSRTVLNAMSAEHLVLEADGVILHASFIEHDGKAILFTAPSGTGKSTQADLWAKYRGADIINGDRAVIRLIDGEPYACGIPFAGSSKYCKNAELPIKAIVCLRQAPVSTIVPLKPLDAFKKFWEECTVNTWNPEDVEKATSIVLGIALRVPAFQLSCTPDKSAVRVLEGALSRI